MTYPELLAQLFAARRFGMQLGLDRMRAALAALGHPERRLGRVIHVGGTNGKGSTCAFIERCLRAQGYCTALYTSPHLCRFTERIQVMGRELPGEDLARLWEAHRQQLEHLTFFEQATCLAFLAFGEHTTEVTVLEVGLGGRFDATNVVDADVAVVTGVAMDHMEHLGDTIEKIAFEKAGIFKAGRAVVLGPSGDPAARPVLEAEARRVGVGSLTEVTQPARLPLGLAGAHQAANAATCLAALDALAAATGLVVDLPAREQGLSAARWPGRLERFGEVWLDGAHNPDGARALAAEVGGPCTLVIGVSADKDVAALAEPLVRQATTVIATQAPSERAMAAEALASQLGELPGPEGRRVLALPSPAAALERAQHEPGLKVVCGSLFLVGAVRPLLTGEPVDPLIVSDPVKPSLPYR